MRSTTIRARGLRLALCGAAAAVPIACAAPLPPAAADNPFLGTWTTVDHNAITFRPDTVVEHAANGERAAFGQANCRGVFRFGYAERSRADLLGLLPRQPALQQRLAGLLPAPSYKVAALTCDQGDQTYVLTAPTQLVAIYRDGDIGAVERLARR